MGYREPYGIPGIEPRSALCKANALPAIVSLWSLALLLFVALWCRQNLGPHICKAIAHPHEEAGHLHACGLSGLPKTHFQEQMGDQ